MESTTGMSRPGMVTICCLFGNLDIEQKTSQVVKSQIVVFIFCLDKKIISNPAT